MPAGSAALQRRRRHPPACWLAGGAQAPAKVDGERAVCTKCSWEALCRLVTHVYVCHKPQRTVVYGLRYELVQSYSKTY
jgi:hypothetical protein